MHDEIRNELEGYLSGENVSRSFTKHMDSCANCAQEIAGMDEVSASIRFLHDPAAEDYAPSAGFYARLTDRIQTEQTTPLWGVFFPDLQFFRRVAFASLMLLAVLGSYLVSRESDYAAAGGSEYAVLTEHNSIPAHEGSADRQMILTTLASYEH